MVGHVVAEQRAQPEREAVEEDRLGRVGRRQRRREVEADIDRRPVCRPLASMATRSDRRAPGRPRQAVPRNQARPSPASRRVVASPNRLLPLRVPPSARIRGLATGSARASRAITARARTVAASVSSTDAPSPSPSQPPRARTARARRARDRRRRRPPDCRDRDDRPRQRQQPTPATTTAVTAAIDDVRQRHARREPGAEASRADASTQERDRPATGSQRETDARRRRAIAAARVDPDDAVTLASAATWLARSDEDHAATPPGPTAGSSRARSAAAGSVAMSASAVSARPSRWRPPETDGRSSRRRRSRRAAVRPREPSRRSGTAPTSPDRRPDGGERRGSGIVGRPPRRAAA